VDQACLELVQDGDARTVRVTGRGVLVGRSAACDIALTSDPAVSQEHAVVERGAGGWVVRDTGSRNGTFVNGRRLSAPHPLSPGDEIDIGHHRVVFRLLPAHPGGGGGYLDADEEWGAAAPPPARRERGTDDRPVPPPAAPAPAAEGPRRGRGHVRGVARGVQFRSPHEQGTVVTFRVERYDAAGNRLAPVAVEYRGHSAGHLGDGEEVEVLGRWARGVLQARRVVNVSTGSEVGTRSALVTIVQTVMVVLVLGFIGAIIVSVVLS
jgi:hypothetical protein